MVRRYHSNVFWGDRMLTLDKAAAFLQDPAFQRARSHAASSTGRNQYASPQGIAWRFNTLIWAARSCLPLVGDYIECGVFRGDMSWMISEMVDLHSAGKSLYLYDTFAGFDPRYSSEDDIPEAPQNFWHANDEYRAPDIESSVRGRFAAKPYVKIIRVFRRSCG